MSREEILAKRKNKRCKVLSICGTVSDMVLSIVLCVPCALVEVALCLRDVQQQATSQKIFLACVLLTVLFLPVIVVGFVLTILYETIFLKTIIDIDENGNEEIEYLAVEKKDKTSIKDTPDYEKDYTILKVTVIRGSIIVNERDKLFQSLFGRPSRYVEISLGTKNVLFTHSTVGVLETSELGQTILKHHWHKGQDFFLKQTGGTPNRTLVVKVLDSEDRVVGKAEQPVVAWIANGRFEGDIDIADPVGGQKVGTVSCTVSVELKRPKPIPKCDEKDTPKMRREIRVRNVTSKRNDTFHLRATLTAVASMLA